MIGLKENFIIGKLIPAGTGMGRYRNIGVVDPDATDMVPETDDRVADPSADGKSVPGNDDAASREAEKSSGFVAVEQEEPSTAEA